MIGLMKKVFAPFLVTLFFLGIFSVQFMPAHQTFAQVKNTGGGQDTGGSGGQDTGGSGGQDTGSSIVLENPLGNTDTIPEFIEKLLGIILKIGVPIVALFIIYSGFLFVLARGNSNKLKEAKDTFLYTVLGAAILLGAWVLAQAIKGTVDALS